MLLSFMLSRLSPSFESLFPIFNPVNPFNIEPFEVEPFELEPEPEALDVEDLKS
jgi:hypothetical protein